MGFVRRLKGGDLHNTNRVVAFMLTSEMDALRQSAEQVLMAARHGDTSLPLWRTRWCCRKYLRRSVIKTICMPNSGGDKKIERVRLHVNNSRTTSGSTCVIRELFAPLFNLRLSLNNNLQNRDRDSASIYDGTNKPESSVRQECLFRGNNDKNCGEHSVAKVERRSSRTKTTGRYVPT